MTFLHPWAMVVAVVAAGLPLAIHWLTRPRPVRYPLSTLRFVREAIRQRRARHRLRDLLILLLRTAAILLIGMAIARPQFGRQSLIDDRVAGESVRVVLVDVSQSMAAIDGGIQRIDRAKTIAAEYMRYRPGLRANLIFVATRPDALFSEPSTNFEELRKRLGDCRATAEPIDVRRGLESAATFLMPRSETDTRPRELVVISDFQRTNWARADFSVLPEGTKIQLESVAATAPLGNIAVLRASCRGRAARGGSAVIEVDIGNFSLTDRHITSEVSFGTATYRLDSDCPAGAVTTLVQEVAIDAAGWQWGAARLVDVDDALAADDATPLVVEVRPKPLYALITRQSPRLRPSSSHFLECALIPDTHRNEKASARLVRFDPNKLSREQLAPTDLIALDHPGKLSDESVQLLSGLLRRGRPMLYVAAEAVDATNLVRLREAVGRAWQMPVEFALPPTGRVRRGLFLASFDADGPPFRVFGDTAAAAYADVRFGGGLVTRRTEHGAEDDILATLNDGTALLVLSSIDAGMIAVLNADLAASNISATGSFVPLVEELVQMMLGRDQRDQRYICGNRLRVLLPGEVTSPAGLMVESEPMQNAPAAETTTAGDLLAEADGVIWNWNAPADPGVYRVVTRSSVEGNGDKGNGQTVFALPVQLAIDESRLDSLPPDVLTERLAGSRTIAYSSVASGDTKNDDFWKWLAAGCVLCLVGEFATLAWLRV